MLGDLEKKTISSRFDQMTFTLLDKQLSRILKMSSAECAPGYSQDVLSAFASREMGMYSTRG